jgi:Cd2+/Zn2+-exporting ATPase
MTAPDTKETTFIIPDLCCATEEALIRKKLTPREDIQELAFNVVSHKLKVRHTCSEEVILRLLKEAGLPGIKVTSSGLRQTTRVHRILLMSTIAAAAFFLAGLAAHVAELPPYIATAGFLASMMVGGWQIAWKGIKAILSRRLDMNTLMTVAAIGAVLLGEYAEGAAVILLFAISLLLESLSLDRSRRAIQSLLTLSPQTASVKRDGKERVVPVEELRVGEVIVVRPGERIPMDGEVVAGYSAVNQAAITGESMPVPKGMGDTVYAGSLNQHGALEIRVTRLSTDTTLARIVHLIEEAQSQKAPLQSFIERFAHVYTPAVFALAIGMTLLPPLLFHSDFSEWFYRALVVLVIACPCALVISTPVTIVSAMTNAARHGILVKGGKHLEALADVRAVAFDKTGTLTEGKPEVTDVVPLDSLSPRDILQLVAAAELKSEHHLADALVRKALEEGIDLSTLRSGDFFAITGKGIRTTLNGREYVVGNHQLVEEMGVCSPRIEEALQRLEQQGKTVVLLADSESVLGVIAIADRVRKDARATLQRLHSLGIEHTILLSGDNRLIAESVARELGFDEARAELLPEHKLEVIRSLQSTYRKVAMVGDGINDAPALAAADVGIAMGGIGSDTALETADVVLMSDNILRIPHAIRLGKKALAIIKQNIVLALGTKLVFLILGALGWSTLWLAILADDGVALLVVLNGMRLLNLKENTYL